MISQIRIIEEQEEEIREVNTLSEEETKAFLYKNHPDMFKKLYPTEVPISKREKSEVVKSRGDIQQTDKEYTFSKYDTMDIGGNSISYKIQIKTDMNF